jgi:hypothetical protein
MPNHPLRLHSVEPDAVRPRLLHDTVEGGGGGEAVQLHRAEDGVALDGVGALREEAHVVRAGVGAHRVGEVDHRLGRIDVRQAAQGDREQVQRPLGAPALLALVGPRQLFGPLRVTVTLEHSEHLLNAQVLLPRIGIPLTPVVLQPVERLEQSVGVVRQVGEDDRLLSAGDDHRAVILADQFGDHRARLLDGLLPATRNQVVLVEIEQVADRCPAGWRRGRWRGWLCPRRQRSVTRCRLGVGRRTEVVHHELLHEPSHHHQLEVLTPQLPDRVVGAADGDVELGQPSARALDQADVAGLRLVGRLGLLGRPGRKDRQRQYQRERLQGLARAELIHRRHDPGSATTNSRLNSCRRWPPCDRCRS